MSDIQNLNKTSNSNSNNNINNNITESKEFNLEDLNEYPIKLNEYKNKPDDILPYIRNLKKENNFETAVGLCNEAILLKLKEEYINNNKLHIDLVKFYVEQADILIKKILSNEDLLNNQVKISNNINSKYNDNEEESEDDLEEYEDSDIAFDSLFTAQKIVQTKIEEYEKSTNSGNVNKLYQILADIFLSFSDLEIANSNFDKAINYLKKALDIRFKCENKFSRTIAEIYYQMGLCYDFDSQKNLDSFYKAKIILEYHLDKQIQNSKIKDFYNEKNIIFFNKEEEEFISSKYENIKLESIKINMKNIEPLEDDNEDIKELKLIIKEVYIKITDAVLAVQSDIILKREKEKQIKEKEEKDKQITTTNSFNENYDESKILNVNNLIKKKRKNNNSNTDIDNNNKNNANKSQITTNQINNINSINLFEKSTNNANQNNLELNIHEEQSNN